MSEVMISKRRDFLFPVAIGQIDPAQFEQGLRAYYSGYLKGGPS